MIRRARIQNFKSVQDLDVELGRFNVFIGENGSGKSNILEALAFAAAAASDKLDHEFLATRGVRVTEPAFMRSAFNEASQAEPIRLALSEDGGRTHAFDLRTDESSVSPKWQEESRRQMLQQVLEGARQNPTKNVEAQRFAVKLVEQVFKAAVEALAPSEIANFLVYSPENTALRAFQTEGQILPLGIKGEGLFAHLKALAASDHRHRLELVGNELELIGWFAGFEVPSDLGPEERRLRIRDRYLVDGRLFDQRSANEGFLFLLFYFTLFISPDTPAFFAIDNVDASLNPKLCSELTRTLVRLAGEYGKQVIVTTHNPAVLDGLNLHDDEQRLFVVQRSSQGHTRVRRIGPPKPVEGQAPPKLSEAFLRGYIGGLPKNF